MKKSEFIAKLADELKKRNVADSADVIEEYEQHFDFKLADGYSEEEIAAKLGEPAALAAQFDDADAPEQGSRKSAALTWLWLVWADFFFGVGAVLLLAFGIVLCACVLSFGLTGVCLVGDLSRLPFVSLPPMPYWCSAILGLSLIALSVLFAIGCIWFFAFVRQIFRFYGRFHKNTLSQCRGGAVLPALPLAPKFAPKTMRRLRSVTLVALAVFAVCFVLGYAVCCLSAGSFEFWHVWGWFSHAG